MAIQADMRRRWPGLGPMDRLRANPPPAAGADDEYQRTVQTLRALGYRPRGGLAGRAPTPAEGAA